MHNWLKTIISVSCFLACMTSMQAKVKYGVKVGYNISKMELNTNVFDASHRNGFYLGPTMKIDLLAGFDFDMALFYNRIESNVSNFLGDQENVGRSSGAFQINLRKGFGFGDTSDVFIFAGPQWDLNFSKRDWDVFDGGHLRWSETVMSVNVGIGAMLFGTLEAKVSYNIACDSASDITFRYITDEIRESPKGSTWQLGLAVYF